MYSNSRTAPTAKKDPRPRIRNKIMHYKSIQIMKTIIKLIKIVKIIKIEKIRERIKVI